MATMVLADNTGARRSTNKKNAFQFATLGLGVFVSDGKVPLIPRYNKWDHEITAEERDAAVTEYAEKHDGAAPAHVGCTKDIAVLKKLFRLFPDAVPSIACGPSKLLVLDADAKDNGPELLGALFAEHGGVPQGVPVIPTKSGGKHFIFRDLEGKYTNKAGLLKKQYGTDVRGTGGQFVAPGSIRVDGKTYGTNDDKLNFLRAIHRREIPTIPEFIAEMIGFVDYSDDGVTHIREREVIQTLREADEDAAAAELDPSIGRFDLERLKEQNEEFRALHESPSGDCSTNRFLAARHLMTEWPNLPAQALAAFFQAWEGAGSFVDSQPATGEYDYRQIAREWLKNQGLSKPSRGEAFGAVEDEDGERSDDQFREKAGRLAQRFDYLEQLRTNPIRLLDWAIKFFIARGTTSIVSGQWGAGKTAVFVDIALHIAHGIPWRGRRVAKGVAIYVGLENPDDVQRRVKAWCEHMEQAGYDVQGGAFVLHRGPCCLFDDNGKPTRDEKDLIAIAKQAADHYGVPVGTIIVDTLSQSISPGNDREDGSIYTAALQRIANATGANVTALHHPTKAGDAVRGDSALQGNVDTIVEVSRDQRTGTGTIKAGSKFRIGNPSKVNFGYRLQSHIIGKDEDGEDIEVVLAVERVAGAAMSAIDDTEDEVELAKLTSPDTPADKLRATLRVFRERAEDMAADTGDKVAEVGLTAGQVFSAVNIDRRRSGLRELKDRTVMPKLLAKLVNAGEIVKTGDNRRTEYKLLS